MFKLKSVAVLGLCFLLTPAFAQSLVEKERYANEEKQIVKEVEHYAKKLCKTDIEVKFDWSTFDKEAIKKYSPSGYCKEALAGVGRICERSEEGLKVVQSKIKKLTCKQAKPRSFSLNNGEFVFGIDFDAANDRDEAIKFLENNL